MKKWFPIIAVCLIGFMAQSERLKTFVLNDFRDGLNTKNASVKLKQTETPDCQNVLFDESDTIYSRQGYSQFCTLPVSGNIYAIDEYKKQSGEKWLMVHVATSVYASKDDGTTWLKVKEGLSEVYAGNSVTYDNEWWFTNGVDDVFSWNADTATSYGFIPQGKHIEVHNNQLFVANVPENYSAIFWCSSMVLARTIDGWQYSNSFVVGENQGDTITALKSEGSVLTIYKQGSVWYLSGDGGYYDIPVKYTDVYGCSSQKSLSKYKGTPIFLSKEGLCSYSGGSIKQVDRNIDDLTRNANVNVGTIVGKYWMQTTENDFALGITSHVKVTNGVIQTFSSKKGNAEKNLSATRYNMIVEGRDYRDLKQGYSSRSNLTAGQNHSFSRGGNFNGTILPSDSETFSWNVGNVGINLKRISPDIFQSSITVTISNTTGTVLGSCTRWITDLGNGSWYHFFTTYTVQVPMTISIDAYYKGGGNDGTGAECLVNYTKELTIGYDYAEERKSGADYAAYKAAMLANGWEIVKDIHWGWGDHTISFRKPIKDENYSNIVYNYEYSMTPSTWGYYTSQKFNAGTNINTWKHFLTADSGDNITYQVKFATGTDALDTASWTTITNGSLITATTSQYWTQWKATLNDEYQRIESVMLRWFEVNGSDYQDAYASFYNNRYHVVFSTYGYTNNLMIIYDDNEKFTKWNVSAECIGTFNNQLLFGKSNVIYKLYDTWNDNGSAINKYWESKWLDLDSPDYKKYVEKIGVTTKGSGTLALKWKTNYDTSWSTAAITMASDWKNEVINIPNNSPFKHIKVRVENTSADEYFEVAEIRIYYRYAPLRAD